MKLSVLIPYRPDSPRREKIYEATSKMWRSTGAEVIYAEDGLTGLFSFSRAINNARRKATGDCFLSYSVDAIPPGSQILGQLTQRLGLGTPWIAGWRGQARFNEYQTEQILAGREPNRIGTPMGGICLGVEALVAVRADVWDAVNGYDERFVGWGPEDRAWYVTLKTLYPRGVTHAIGELFHTLWHPSTPKTMLKANVQLYREYQKNVPNFREWYFSRPPAK